MVRITCTNSSISVVCRNKMLPFHSGDSPGSEVGRHFSHTCSCQEKLPLSNEFMIQSPWWQLIGWNGIDTASFQIWSHERICTQPRSDHAENFSSEKVMSNSCPQFYHQAQNFAIDANHFFKAQLWLGESASQISPALPWLINEPNITVMFNWFVI